MLWMKALPVLINEPLVAGARMGLEKVGKSLYFKNNKKSKWHSAKLVKNCCV